jgi:hypothetical protein
MTSHAAVVARGMGTCCVSGCSDITMDEAHKTFSMGGKDYHEGDIISIYKHNEKLLKKSGDKVSAGAPIALVGNTGDLSTGTHLHFELWHKGEAVDPAKYINF